MARAAAMPAYPDLGRDEDERVKPELCRRGRVAEPCGRPWLCIYTYHGANTWDRAHHDAITEWAGVQASTVRAAAGRLVAELDAYPAEVLPERIVLMSRDGRVGSRSAH